MGRGEVYLRLTGDQYATETTLILRMEVWIKRAVVNLYQFVPGKPNSNLRRIDLNHFANRADGNVGRRGETDRIHDSLPDHKGLCLIHTEPCLFKND